MLGPEPAGKEELLERILSGARAMGWNVTFLNNQHPFDLALTKHGERLVIRTYVWRVTHGGGERRPADEYRIQITPLGLQIEPRVGARTLVLGWYEPLYVIAAFDPTHRQRPGASQSVQISLGTLEQASNGRLAVQERAPGEIAVAFPELLPAYVETQAALHGFADHPNEIEALRIAGQGEEVPPEVQPGAPEREWVVQTITRRARDAGFGHRVLAAYDHACAMCLMQMGLIQGAHIVPVAENGTDETSNGLALCPLHHAAYDAGLIGVNAEYHVVAHEARLGDLRKQGLAGGDDRVLAPVGQVIHLPGSESDRPSPGYLMTGLLLRGWQAK